MSATAVFLLVCTLIFAVLAVVFFAIAYVYGDPE